MNKQGRRTSHRPSLVKKLANKENENSASPSKLKGVSPSKMTDEQKVIYKNLLFREADEIHDSIKKQIEKTEEVRF